MSKEFVLAGRAILFATAFTFATACGGDGDGGNGPGNGTTTTFAGVISQDDGLASGSVEFVVETATPAPPAGSANLVAPVNLTGTLKLGGTVSLTGTYDPNTSLLSATGGGFTLDGGFDGTSRLEGTWTGPGGKTGTFVTTRGNSPTAFCGTYDEDDDGSVDGTFSFVIYGNQLAGERYAITGGPSVPLDGVVNNNNIQVYFPGTQVVLAVGTRNGNSVSGTFDDQQGTTGTWTGSTAACQ